MSNASPIKTDIPARERLIFALDVPDLERARTLVDTLGDAVEFYKLGLEFFLSGHYFELAAELLENSDLSVNEIARELGYSTTSNFIRAFQRMSGLTPSKYRTLQK